MKECGGSVVCVHQNDRRAPHQGISAGRYLPRVLCCLCARSLPRPRTIAADLRRTAPVYLESSNHRLVRPIPLWLQKRLVWQMTSHDIPKEERGAVPTKDIDADSAICFLHTVGKILFTLGTSLSRVQKAGPQSRLFVLAIRLIRTLQRRVESAQFEVVRFPFFLGISSP